MFAIFEGNLLGKLAFEQTKQYIEAMEVEEEEEDGEGMAIGQNQNGIFLGDTAASSAQQKPSANPPSPQQSASNQNLLFEQIENLDFNAIYQCIHIHETLGTMDGFVTRYTDLRKRERNKILGLPLIYWVADETTKDSKKRKKKNKKKTKNKGIFEM